MSTQFGFSIQEFFICLFKCQKTAFVCEFQHTPLCKMTFFQGSIWLVDMRFCRHVPNSPRNKNLKSLNPYLLYKMVFLAPKALMYPLSIWINKKNCSTLNLMSLQTVWNECVRFGGHINMQVSYKILWLEVQKKASILHNLPCFQEGCFEAVLDSMWPLMFRG
jgi:hypothetical protein